MKNKKVLIGVNIVLIIALMAVVVFSALWFSGVLDKHENKLEQSIIAVDGNGSGLSEGQSYPMPQNMIFTRNAAAEQSVGLTLNATVTPSYAADKTVDWAVAFVDETNEWAVGKNASDYIYIVPTSDGSLSANVSCTNAFGAQIKIIVQSRNNADAKAECVIDYAQRLQQTSIVKVTSDEPEPCVFVFNDMTSTISLDVPLVKPNYVTTTPRPGYGQVSWWDTGALYRDHRVKFEYVYNADYTVENTVVQTNVFIKRSEELVSALTSKGGTNMTSDWIACGTSAISYGDIIEKLGGNLLKPGTGSPGGQKEWNLTSFDSVLSCFSQTSTSDFSVKIVTNMKYGGTIVSIYTAHFSHDSVLFSVLSVEVNKSTFIV